MPIQVNGRPIGPEHPVFIVAELSGNHGQDLDTAVALIRAAKDAGADAVKLQTYTPDTLTLDSDAAPFQIREGPWEGRTLHALYGEAYTPWEWHPRLKEVAEGLGLHLFSSPFDPSAVEYLEEQGVPAYKIASFEVVDIPLIQRVARTGKPVILSTGLASFAEDQIESNARAAIEVILKAKPSSSKGVYVQSIALTATMGPSIKLDPSQKF